MAAPDSNFGSQVYLIPCGVPSDANIQFFLSANSGTHYFHNSVNDFILWDQPDFMVQPQTNIGTVYYFYESDRPSDVNIQFFLSSNAGTHFYFSTSFNHVSFCD